MKSSFLLAGTSDIKTNFVKKVTLSLTVEYNCSNMIILALPAKLIQINKIALTSSCNVTG